MLFPQMASGAGWVYTDGDVAQYFQCTSNSPVHPPDTYKLTTGGVTVYFPLTHVFCGEIHQGYWGTRATGFHSTAAQSNDNPSAKHGDNMDVIYDARNNNWIPIWGKTFFSSTLTVKGLSNCISKWAAECYNNNIHYFGDCMHLTNIPYLNSGIQVFFSSSGPPEAVTLTFKTAYPTDYSKGNCITCESLQSCDLWQ